MELFKGTLEEVKRLFDLEIDINYKNDKGMTALIYACKKGNLDTVKVLCEAGADINLLDFESKSSLHYACKKDY